MIEPAQLDEVVSLVRERGLGSPVVDELRQRLPGIHFTYCMDDDVTSAKPVHQEADFNVYLVDGRDHCLCFTQDIAAATGLVLAEVEEDDE